MGKLRGVVIPSDVKVTTLVYDRLGKVAGKRIADIRPRPDGIEFVSEIKIQSGLKRPGIFAVAIIATSAGEVIAERYVPIPRIPWGYEEMTEWRDFAPLGERREIDVEYDTPPEGRSRLEQD